MDLSETFRVIQSILDDIIHAPDGLSTGDIVRKYGISRRVVPKYIDILQASGVPIYTDRKRYYVDEGYRAGFTLTAGESELLALSLQRSLVLHGSQWGAIRSLIHKLSNRMVEGTATGLIRRMGADRNQTSGDRCFSILAKAKRKRLEVWVEYHALNRAEPSRWRIRPYEFFANPFSDGLYVLCEGTRDGETFIPLSLKFDRILDVSPTDVKFAISDLARFVSQEGRAWGVWWHLSSQYESCSGSSRSTTTGSWRASGIPHNALALTAAVR
jgi:predicted DNA-binding transcriptional regulator YafY